MKGGPIIGAVSQTKLESNKAGMVYGLIAAFIWGAYLTLSSKGIQDGLLSQDLALLRYLTSGLIMLPFLFRTNLWRNLTPWRVLSLTLLGGPLFVLISAGGYYFAPLAHGAVLQLGSMTLLSIALAAFMLGEQVSRRQKSGIALVLTGLAVIAGPALLQNGQSIWIGDLMFVFAGAMWALFAVLVRRWQIEPLAAVAVIACVAAVFYTPGYILLTDDLSRITQINHWSLLEQIVMQGIVAGILAVFAYARAVHILGPGKAALFPAMSPAVAVLLGIPLMGVYPSVLQIVGLIVVSAGILLAMNKMHQSKPK